MAMKFWFGKKDSEQNIQKDVACDVLISSDGDGKGKETVSSLFAVPQSTGIGSVPAAQSLSAPPVFSAANGGGIPDGTPFHNQGMEADPVKNCGAAGAESRGFSSDSLKEGKTEKPVVRNEGGNVGAVLSSEAAISDPKKDASAIGAKAILRPVGSLSARVPPGAPSVSAAPVLVPVSSVAGVRPAMAKESAGAVPAASHPMAFGLRPKANAAPASVAAAPVAQPATTGTEKVHENADAERSIIRPKTDQKALYYELMNGLYDAVLILDNQGHVVDSNARVASVLGYTREDSWDLPIGKVITGMSSQMLEHLKRNLAESHHVLLDARCFRQDGTSFMAEVGVSTLSLTRGGNNMVFAIRNVERRKNAMDELRKSQSALQVALVPAFVCDTEGFFQIVNQALLESFGIPDEVQAKSVRFVDLLPDAARFFLRAACGEKIRESLLVSTPNGPSVKVEVSFTPVQSGENVVAVAGSILQV